MGFRFPGLETMRKEQEAESCHVLESVGEEKGATRKHSHVGWPVGASSSPVGTVSNKGVMDRN